MTLCVDDDLERPTERLLGHLNRVFGSDPLPRLAMRVNHASGNLGLEVRDWKLILTAGAVTLSYCLLDVTLGELRAAILAEPDFSVPYYDPEIAPFRATRLYPQINNQASSNGDRLYAYTNPVWDVFDAIAYQLALAKREIDNLLEQMNLQTAAGEWIDEHGGYYAVPRAASETDGVYGPRIIAEILRPKGNNVAIGEAIAATIGGLTVRVNDCPVDVVSNSYGLFDVVVTAGSGYGGTVSDLFGIVRVVAERMRDAGTQLNRIEITTPVTAPLFVGAVIVDGETIQILPKA